MGEVDTISNVFDKHWWRDIICSAQLALCISLPDCFYYQINYNQGAMGAMF